MREEDDDNDSSEDDSSEDDSLEDDSSEDDSSEDDSSEDDSLEDDEEEEDDDDDDDDDEKKEEEDYSKIPNQPPTLEDEELPSIFDANYVKRGIGMCRHSSTTAAYKSAMDAFLAWCVKHKAADTFESMKDQTPL
jgi:hypothetical protein